MAEWLRHRWTALQFAWKSKPWLIAAVIVAALNLIPWTDFLGWLAVGITGEELGAMMKHVLALPIFWIVANVLLVFWMIETVVKVQQSERPLSIEEASFRQQYFETQRKLDALLEKQSAYENAEKKEVRRKAAVGALARLVQEGQGILAGTFGYNHPSTDRSEWRKRFFSACKDEFPDLIAEMDAVRERHMRSGGDHSAFSGEVGHLGELVTFMRR
jgi:uncharacterized membrane protein